MQHPFSRPTAFDVMDQLHDHNVRIGLLRRELEAEVARFALQELARRTASPTTEGE